MNMEKLREELEADEGVKYEVYNDHLGYATFGIGHLILDSDPEQGSSVGTPVSESRVAEAFQSDIVQVVSDCETLYPDFESLPLELYPPDFGNAKSLPFSIWKFARTFW